MQILKSVFVLCLLASLLCLGVGNKHDEKTSHHGRVRHHEKAAHNQRSEDGTTVGIELHPVISQRHGLREKRSGNFSYDFSKIPGGEGFKVVYDETKNALAAANTNLSLAAIWDGISGRLGLLNLKDGGLLIIDIARKIASYVQYVLEPVKTLVDNIRVDIGRLGSSALALLDTIVAFSFDQANNFVIDVVDVLNVLANVTSSSLQTVLGPLYEPIKKSFGDLFNLVEDSANVFQHGIMALVEPIFGAIKGISQPLVDIFAAVIRTADGVFDGTLFATINDRLQAMLKNVVNGVVGSVQKVSDGFFSVMSSVINGIGSIFGNMQEAVFSATRSTRSSQFRAKTVQVKDDESMMAVYGKNGNFWFTELTRLVGNTSDLIIYYIKEGNYLTFYDKKKKALAIWNGNKGFFGLFDTQNGAGLFMKAKEPQAYLLDANPALKIFSEKPNLRNVIESLGKLNLALQKFNGDLQNMHNVLTVNIIDIMKALSAGKALNSVLSGDLLIQTTHLVGNLLKNLLSSVRPMIRPSLGAVNIILSFFVNLPENLRDGFANLIGGIVEKFTGLFTPELMSKVFRELTKGVIKGITTPLFANILIPLKSISGTIDVTFATINKILDLVGV